jgi:putative peptidoglycan lipid II flippase
MSARKMIRSTWGVSALTLLSRILGLARDKALVLVFGAAPAVLDSFLLAFTIPNLFRRLFGEGALSGAFIPVFVDTRENRGPREADRLAGAVLTALTLLLGAATAAGILACLGGARLAGPDSEHGLALTLTAAMLPFMLFVCVAAILGGMLQSVRVFALPAAMPVALNLAFLAVLGYIHFHAPDTEPPQAACWVALAVVAAGAAQVALQWPALLARGVRVLPSFAFRQEGIGRILRAMGPTALGLAVFQEIGRAHV